MAEPTVLSGSSLNTWNECPREWEYTYLWRLERPPSFKMAIGTAAHYAVEVAMNIRLESGEYPPIDTWLDAYHTSWKTETADTKPKNDTPAESAAEHYRSGVRCVEFYESQIAPTIVPYATEMPVRFTINGHVWTGTIDLLELIGYTEQEQPRIRLRDHKFTGKRPDNPLRYKWPMVGYSIGLRRELHVIEEDVQLDYFIRNKKVIHFPVANGGPYTDQDYLDLAQEIENAMSAIARGSFPTLGTETGACNWCPYWDICPAYRGRKRKE